jgi:hypothetical protein
LAAPAQAALVYGMPATSTGSRSVASGELTDTGDSSWDDATISWSIVDNLNGTLTYTYTLAGFNMPSVSHFSLDLTDDAIDGDSLADPDAVTDAKIDGDPIAAEDIEFGSGPNWDGLTGAVKFDVGTEDDSVIYSFTSNREPVWGNVGVKGGGNTLNNVGLGLEGSSMLTSEFIARPNGVAKIPEPGAVFFGAAACALVGLMKGRRWFAARLFAT